MKVQVKLSEKYIDELTGAHMTVEYDVPEHPRTTIVFPENHSLSYEQCNEAITRLMRKVGLPYPDEEASKGESEEQEKDWVLLENGTTWENASYGMRAYVKWDGCTHLWFAQQDNLHALGCYHHICDIDEFIKAMQALRAKVTQKFDQELAATSEADREGLCLPFHLHHEEQLV